jgi:hypothetical protein
MFSSFSHFSLILWLILKSSNKRNTQNIIRDTWLNLLCIFLKVFQSSKKSINRVHLWFVWAHFTCFGHRCYISHRDYILFIATHSEIFLGFECARLSPNYHKFYLFSWIHIFVKKYKTENIKYTCIEHAQLNFPSLYQT